MRKGNISAREPDVWIFHGSCLIKSEEKDTWFSKFGFKKKLVYRIDSLSFSQLDKLSKMGIKIEIKTELDIKGGNFIDKINCFYDIIEELKLRGEVKRYIDCDIERLQVVDNLRLPHLGLVQFTNWIDFWRNI